MSMNPALPSTLLHGLFHIEIKTSDLEATRVFWCDIIGLREIARLDPAIQLSCEQDGPAGQARVTQKGASLLGF